MMTASVTELVELTTTQQTVTNKEKVQNKHFPICRVSPTQRERFENQSILLIILRITLSRSCIYFGLCTYQISKQIMEFAVCI